MEKSVLNHVFSSLQSLEKCLAQSKNMLREQKVKPVAIHQGLREQARVLAHMRRVANRLQLDLARQDSKNIVRSLQIYYGLVSMVRSEIIGTYSALANGSSGLQLRDAETMFH